MEDCVFCKIIRGEIKSEIVLDDENFLVIKDANPICEGHSLIIPKKHFETVLDLPNSNGAELLKIIKEVSLKVMRDTNSTGFNVVVNTKKSAGQVVPHVHFHIIPRKDGDGLKIASY